MRVPAAIAVSCVLTHYLEQLVFFLLGGHLRVNDIASLSVNCSVMGLMLAIGWATRTVRLVSVVLLVIGVCFIVSRMFALRGTFLSWTMQVSVYVALPLVSAILFLLLSKAASVPERPMAQQSSG